MILKNETSQWNSPFLGDADNYARLAGVSITKNNEWRGGNKLKKKKLVHITCIVLVKGIYIEKLSLCSHICGWNMNLQHVATCNKSRIIYSAKLDKNDKTLKIHFKWTPNKSAQNSGDQTNAIAIFA